MKDSKLKNCPFCRSVDIGRQDAYIDKLEEKLAKTRFLLDYLTPHGGKYTEEDIENLCKSRGYYDQTFKPR